MKAHSDFVHLHVHSQYSLLDGACRLEGLIEQAARHRMPALALTDHGNLFGAIEFYQACMKRGVKPILGVETYVAPDSRFEKSSHGISEASFHLVLLARDEQGYRNLMKLVSLGYLEGFYYRPRIDKELLAKYGQGLMALSGCLASEIPHLLVAGQEAQARRVAGEFVELFGKGHFYLELQDHQIPDQAKVNRALVAMAADLGLPLVATNDLHYLEKPDAKAHEALLCIQTGTTLDDPNRFRFANDEFYFKSPEEMSRVFHEVPEAVRRTVEVAEKSNIELDFSTPHLPQFTPPAGKPQAQYLRELVEAGVRQRYPSGDGPVRQRIDHELAIIEKTGFTSYFLIAWDFVHRAKSQGIPVGPGRGSAAGSVVSYCLGITDIDPLKYDLLFERFLNPDRVSFPDIDIDFCYERRPEVISYVQQKYGKHSVAQIITFGTMMAKAVVRDVARVMGFSYPEADRIAKLIPFELGMTLQRALELTPELKVLYESDPRVGELIDTSMKLEGLTRHASTHAAGVVIADGDLTDYIPVFKTSDDQITTGYAQESIEQVGLLKMDFLGLRTLTVIDETAKIVKRTRHVELDMAAIPLDDPATYRMLANAESTAVFQLESSGMRDLLRKLKPDRFEDLIALLALFRPGPIGSGMVDDFIKRRHGQVRPAYDHPLLEPILKETYGIIVYQEQVMRIVSTVAGFSLSRADLLRRAMGKKTPEIMEQARADFLAGAAQRGLDQKTAERIFEKIAYFAGYGFNKCVVGSTRIVDAETGGLVTVEALFRSGRLTTTRSLDEHLRLVKRRILDVVSNGPKRVFKVTTRLGRTITVTDNHPFLTIEGWKELKELRPGDFIAAPRSLAMLAPQDTLEPYQLATLAAIISEGNTCHPSGVYVYNKSPIYVCDFLQHACQFDLTVPTVRRRSLYEVYAGTGRGRTPAPFYATSSERLASQVQHLLLRYATSDVYWDRIRSIEPAGVQETYDLEIEDTHNFVANDLIVHNSHSAAYAVISYRTAYLKANYPAEFMAALLTSERENLDKIAQYIEEAKRMGIQILPPDVNESFAKFTVINPTTIRFGLSAVKNVGQGAIDAVIEARDVGGAPVPEGRGSPRGIGPGRFVTLYDFCERVDLRQVNRKVLESLIKCGAFDSLGLRRSQLMAILDRALDVASGTQQDRQVGQLSLFDAFKQQESFTKTLQDVPNIREWPESQRLAFEKELLGFYLTGHPLARHERLLKAYASASIEKLGSARDGAEVTLGGVIAKVRVTTTKRGNERMAILRLEDFSGSVEVLVFPKAFATCEQAIRTEAIVFITGRVSLREEEPKLLASEVMLLEEARQRFTQGITIRLLTAGLESSALEALYRVLKQHAGSVPVTLAFTTPEHQTFHVEVGDGCRVDPSGDLFHALEELLGPDVVDIRTAATSMGLRRDRLDNPRALQYAG